MTAFHDPDAALAKIERDIEMAQERAARAVRARQEIDQVRGTASSRRGEVSAQVDATGVLSALRLSDDALDLGPVRLAELIQDTVRAASRDAAQRALQVADAEFGEGSQYTAHLRAELEGRSR